MTYEEEKCILTLEKLYFEKIYFERIGTDRKSSVELEMNVQISENEEKGLHKVSLKSSGKKKDDYIFEVTLIGMFSVGKDNTYNEALINQNTVAILMPYMRSQISLLTAQPDVDCLVLPPFNIAEMMNND